MFQIIYNETIEKRFGRQTMKIKKIMIAGLMLLSMMLLTACGKSTEYYFAAKTPTPDSSWVSYVIVEKKGDKITNAHWSAYHIAGELAGYNYLSKKNYDGRDKYVQSKDKIYIMEGSELDDKNPKPRWDEQVDLLVDKLIESQDYNDRLPIPAGASIQSTDFYELVEMALSQPAIPKGKYEDGFHYISLKNEAANGFAPVYWDSVLEELVTVVNEGEEFKTFSFGNFVVVNGTIVLAYFNEAYTGYLVDFDETGKARKHTIGDKSYPILKVDRKIVKTSKEISTEVSTINKETGEVEITTVTTIETTTVETITPLVRSSLKKLTKNQLGLSYLMKKPNGPGQYEYFEASNAAAKYLVTNQNFDIQLSNDGKPVDSIAGVTITATDFKKIASLIPMKP